MPHVVDAYRLARWLCGSATDAEDIVQEASLRAFRSIAGFGGGNARAWVLAIVRNTAMTWLARNRRPTVVLSADLEQSGGSDAPIAAADNANSAETPETLLIAKSDADGVRRRVAALPPAFREVLVLREIHELSYQEIAAIVEVPVGTVMSRLARARRAMVGGEGAGS